MKTIENKDFVLRIPLSVWEKLDSVYEVTVLGALLSFAGNGRGKCFAGVRAISNRAKCSKAKTTSTISRLINKGFVKVSAIRTVRGGKTPIYTLSVHDMDTLANKSVHVVTEVSAPEQVSQAIKYINKDRYISLNDLDKKEYQLKLSKELNLPTSYIKRKIEELQLWCGSTGRSYTNYNLALRRFISNDKKKGLLPKSDLEEIREEYADAVIK